MLKVIAMVMINIVITLAFASAQTVYYGNIPNKSGEIVNYSDAYGGLAGSSYRFGDIVTFNDKNGAYLGSARVTNIGPSPSPLSEHYLDGE
jgi:restriction endonuclease S subunit